MIMHKNSNITVFQVATQTAKDVFGIFSFILYALSCDAHFKTINVQIKLISNNRFFIESCSENIQATQIV